MMDGLGLPFRCIWLKPSDALVSTSSVSDSQNKGNNQAKDLNRRSQCVTLDRQGLVVELSRRMGHDAGPALALLDGLPQLFAKSPIFVDGNCLLRQAETIAAVEKVVALQAFQEQALAYAPTAARFVPHARGVFLRYDFHPGVDGPQLFEINTNAGDGLLTDLLMQAQKACPDRTVDGDFSPYPIWPDSISAERAFLTMFLDEWRAERGDAPLRSIAIVDEKPESQFLYPEFLMFERLFKQNGIDADICEPNELTWRDGVLWQGQRPIDLVYNRLTDFGLDDPANACLREAYLGRGVVVTPHPYAHAIYADKHNLALLTDDAALREMGVDSETIRLLLRGIAHTCLVRREDADDLWGRRKRLFFRHIEQE